MTPSLLFCLLAVGVHPGDKVGTLTFTDTRYLRRSLDDFPDRKALVLVFLNGSCPLVPRYLPTLKRLDADYRDKGVQFLGVHVSGDETVLDMATLALEHEVRFPFVKDVDGSVVKATGVERTPEVVVLDGGRRLRYWGRIDDQYRPGGQRAEPTRRDLKEALDAVLADKEVAVPTTPVDGCAITLPGPGKGEVAFAEDVAPLLKKHCWDCHKGGGWAPFALVTYEEVRTKARAIAEVVRDGRMPPWFAAPGHGDFANRRALSARERDTVARWVQGGLARGDEARAPAAPEEVRAEWQIGTPDLILTTGAYNLPAEGDVPYEYVIFPHLFTAETWLEAIQILPDKPRSVHHCNLAYLALGDKFDASNFITGMVPGNEPMRLGDGLAYRIPAGSVVGAQIHFVSTGRAEKCKVRVGFKFASGTIHKRLRHHLFADRRFAIPPLEPLHAVKSAWTLDCDAVGVGLFAHMHLRGRAMRFVATPPDGERETLLLIPNYRFDWQIPYRWEMGKKKLARGTRLECTAWYDNSDFNPFNPDPKKTVRYGQQSHEEMLNGFLFYVDAEEDLKLEVDGKTGLPKKKE